MSSVRIYFDGSARPSQYGDMRACIVAVHDEQMAIQDIDLGKGDAITAEWEALYLATTYAIEKGFDDIEFVGDCLSVIENVAGWARSNKRMQQFRSKFDDLISDRAFAMQHVFRHNNLAGLYLDEGGRSRAFEMCAWLLEGIDPCHS